MFSTASPTAPHIQYDVLTSDVERGSHEKGKRREMRMPFGRLSVFRISSLSSASVFDVPEFCV